MIVRLPTTRVEHLLHEQWQERGAWARARDGAMGRGAKVESQLLGAVSEQIEALRPLPVTERLRLGQEAAESILMGGEGLLFAVDAPEVFADLARVLAVLAYQPRGVFAFGRRWLAELPEGLEYGPLPPPPAAETRKLSEWEHPGDHRRRRLVEEIGEGWRARTELLRVYQSWGYTEARLEFDLGELSSRSVIEHRGNRSQWRRFVEKPKPPLPVLAPPEEQRRISAAQRALNIASFGFSPYTRAQHAAYARWLDLESQRGYESAPQTAEAAARVRARGETAPETDDRPGALTVELCERLAAYWEGSQDPRGPDYVEHYRRKARALREEGQP
jgi:hypothetical protein